MKLCQVVPSLEAQHGGPSKSVYALSAALARAGHAVELLATHPAETGIRQEGSLRVAVYRRDWPQRVCPSGGLRRALQSSDADVFHHHALWLRTLHYTHARTVQRGVFVVSPRGMMSTWAWHHRGWRKRLARTFVHPGALEAVHGWHATSTEEAKEIRALGFAQPVCVAPNGVSAPAADERARAVAHWHEACPAARTRPVALFYSRFHAKKRVRELVDVWLKHAPEEWLLLLVGIPQAYTGEGLERQVAEAGGAARIAVFSGANRPPPYAAASLLLLPSHNENFGLVVAEAMAHGLPVVVSDTTPWREVNRVGCGWCVAWEEFGDAIRSATSQSRGELARRGERGQAWVLREFSWDESARRLTDFYATLARSGLTP